MSPTNNDSQLNSNCPPDCNLPNPEFPPSNEVPHPPTPVPLPPTKSTSTSDTTCNQSSPTTTSLVTTRSSTGSSFHVIRTECAKKKDDRSRFKNSAYVVAFYISFHTVNLRVTYVMKKINPPPFRPLVAFWWGESCYFLSSMRNTAINASCGTSTEPTDFMRFFPSFCFSSSLRLREMSPP